MTNYSPNGHRSADPRLFILLVIAALYLPTATQAAEATDLPGGTAAFNRLIEQLHGDIADQVDQKMLPEERRAQAARLRHAYAKRQIELDAQLKILKIDVLAESKGRSERIEKIIQTVRMQEQTAFEYLTRLQMLRDPSTAHQPDALGKLPAVQPAPARTKPNSGSAFTFEWVPEDVSTGSHD